MTKYAHADVLDQGPKFIKDNCSKVILITAYSSVYATVNGANKIAEATLVTGDFALSGSDVTGTAESGTANTLTDAGAAWSVNAYAGCPVEITSGTGAGQARTVLSNTATQLTVSANWVVNPGADSVFKISPPRVLTATLTGKSGGNAAQGLADGTGMHIAFVDTANSKVLYVTEESSDQPITSGNPIQFNSNPTYTSNQPTT